MYYTDAERATAAAKRRHTRRAKRIQRSTPRKVLQELQAIQEYTQHTQVQAQVQPNTHPSNEQ